MTTNDIDAIRNDLDIRKQFIDLDRPVPTSTLKAVAAGAAQLLAEVEQLRETVGDRNASLDRVIAERDAARDEAEQLTAELAQIADTIAPTVTAKPTSAAVRSLHQLYNDWVKTAHERLAKVDELTAELAEARKQRDEAKAAADAGAALYTGTRSATFTQSRSNASNRPSSPQQPPQSSPM